MKLDLDRLEKVRQRGSKIIARCPACAELKLDRAGDNLAVFDNGVFACVAHQGDREHARRILALAGKDERKDKQRDSARSHPQGGKRSHGQRSGSRNGNGNGSSRSSSDRQASEKTPQQVRADLEALVKRCTLDLNGPFFDFKGAIRKARQRLEESAEAQERIAAEFGVRVETIRRIGVDEGRLGVFSEISIGSRPCLPDRIGYIYPRGIKIRHPWGPESKVRFAWAYGRATEPWRLTLSSWRPWVKNYIITEGESDLIALVDAGMENLTLSGDTAIVASPGTSFRDEWAPLFKGLRVTLMFDHDAAGSAAAARTASLLRQHATQVRILNFRKILSTTSTDTQP